MSATRDYRNAGNAVFPGPFHGLPPLDLWRLFTALPDGRFRSGEEVRTSSQAWLRTMLEKAGVELGDYDQAVITFLAEDVTTVQVIAGWIRRAHGNDNAVWGNARPAAGDDRINRMSPTEQLS